MQQHRPDKPPPRKSLGQHFLRDEAVIERIIACFGPAPQDLVVEIGPGRGALTFRLAGQLRELHVVEIDKALVKALTRQQEGYPGLHIHAADAMTLDYCALAAGRRLRIIGNLPYNVSTPLLFKFLHDRHCIRDMVLMLQKEVVDRMCASPGGRDYGRLSVMLQQSCSVDELFEVGPGAFDPPPKVNSAVVRLAPYPHPPHPVGDPGHFSRVVQTAFSQRRKTIRNALKLLVDGAMLAHAGIDPGARPETLSVADYVRLSELSR
jgi:16S rRNA (adenine1518-N6/adenine1519-N6)-dimethyltransferase